MDTALEVVFIPGQNVGNLRFNPHSNGYCSGRFATIAGNRQDREVSILILMDTALEETNRHNRV